MLPEATMERLAFIRYFYNIAVEQSQQPEPVSSVSVLTFHDGIELFLQLACEHLDVGIKEPKFMEYWELLSPKLKECELAEKASMRRLNSSRVELKHHGTFPSKLSIEAFRASATNFFELNTPLVFGIEFGSISMVNLVQCVEARSSLKEAETLIQEGRTEDALDKIAIAFAEVVDDYENRRRDRFGDSPFFFGESLTFESSFFLGIKDQRFSRFVDKVKDSIEAIQSAMRILSLGLDYRRYAKFRLLTPYVLKIPDGPYHLSRREREKPASIDECRFCFDFVVESAIRLQQSEFEARM